MWFNNILYHYQLQLNWATFFRLAFQSGLGTFLLWNDLYSQHFAKSKLFSTSFIIFKFPPALPCIPHEWTLILCFYPFLQRALWSLAKELSTVCSRQFSSLIDLLQVICYSSNYTGSIFSFREKRFCFALQKILFCSCWERWTKNYCNFYEISYYRCTQKSR